MSRWAKNYAVPLDSLIKEKENTNRPIAARSAGTVGKWGKMGFTSTRTYALKAIPPILKSPDQSPPSGETRLAASTATENTTSTTTTPTTTETVKPKKFFKSRNAVPDLTINTQIIHHLPRAPPSPIRSETSPTKKEKPLKVKTPQVQRERKKSITEKPKKKKKKKEEKKIKPEAPPTRRISRTRRVVNYNEEEDDRTETPIRDLIKKHNLDVEPKQVNEIQHQSKDELSPVEESGQESEGDDALDADVDHEPDIDSESDGAMDPPPVSAKPLTVEHPPIVLRISKGTSRLISTDSEEVINSPVHEQHATNADASILVKQQTNELSSGISVSEELNLKQTKETQKLTIPELEDNPENVFESSSEPQQLKDKNEELVETDETSENQTENEPVKLESLKIVIKADMLRNSFDKFEKKKKKHKNANVKLIEHQFKTPSPQPGNENFEIYRTLPASPSDRDFDSQSSILGSISSKGTGTTVTPSQFAVAVPEENCVVRSRGSSDVTSDLETSQHSSLVAPPSDIESRLESMMDCDDEDPLAALPLGEGIDAGPRNLEELKVKAQEPLTEDILKVLTGETDSMQSKDDEQADNEEKPDEINDSTETAPENAVATGGPDIPPEVASANEITLHTNNVQSEKLPAIREESVEEEKKEAPKGRTTRARRARKNENTVPEISVDQPVKTGGRATRNNNATGSLKNKKTSPPPIRSYTRKRKVEVAKQDNVTPANVTEEDDLSTANIDLVDAPTRNSKSLKSSISFEDDIEKEDEDQIVAEKEYKVKNKFKRTWYERDAKSSHEQKHDLRQKSTKNNTINNSVYNLSSTDSIQANDSVNNNNRDCDEITKNSEDKRSVKLVISTKKGSIFKSRALVPDQDIKKRHIYKHTWDADDELEANSNTNKVKTTPPANELFDDFNEVENPAKLTRVTRQNLNKYVDEPVTSVKCDKQAKEYYTVVRNVKTAHQIQEIGEYQEMDDDVEYILDVLQAHNPISTRCLSAIQLASKCMTPAFRMHVRAHGIVTKFFKALKDARKDLSLSLCTAAIMFVLSQDTLNMDLDRDSLELMMNLLESDASSPLDECSLGNYERNRQKVREMCEELKGQGKAAHLNMENISPGTLAMETLLSMTSKRAGDWFKEELRELGGLEHIIKTICECCHQISDYVVNWTEVLLDKLRTIERCLRVLECVTQTNEKNQHYILSYNNGNAVNTLVKLYKLCDSEIALYPTTDATPKENPGVVIREALVPTLKLLINLTHPFNDSANGSTILGSREGIFDTSFHILLQAPNYIPERCIFELSILVLLFLINLTMHTIPNRNLIMQSHAPSDFGNQFDKVPAIKALIEYFYKCEETAKLVEKNTDEILDNPDKNNKRITSQEEVDETVTKLIQKAGNHMEHTLQACYAGLLIGHLVSGSEENEVKIRSYLKESNFKDIINVLEKYYNFMNLTAGSEATVVSHIKQTKKLIDYLKKRDLHSNSGIKDTDSESVTSPEQNKNAMTTRSTPRTYKTYSQR